MEDFPMTVTMEKTGANQAKLTITIDDEAYNAAMQKAYLIVRNRVNIPGFRKGKAPRQIIESFYSEAVFYDDACNIAIPEAYDKAVAEQGLFTVDRPEIDVQEVGAGKGITFTAEVTLKPEVVIGQYKGLEVTKAVYPVSEEDIETELKQAQERVARWVEASRPVANGDRIMLDYSGMSEGVLFPGGTAENQPLEIGAGRFIPGFEEQLIGMELDQEGDVEVTFPEEYHAEELAGKPATFHVKIREIKGKEVPVVDDEFAKDVSEFDTLEEYKASIRTKLEDANTHRAEHEYEDQLVDLATANAEVEIPECMIVRQADRMAREFEYRLSYQGIKMDDYLRMTGMKREDIIERYKEEAAKAVKTSLVMEVIQKTENIDATDDEVDAELVKMADSRKQSIEDLKKTMGEEDKEYLKDNIIMQKTLKLLSDNAVAKS
jgi:trigger factor